MENILAELRKTDKKYLFFYPKIDNGGGVSMYNYYRNIEGVK